MEFIEVVQASLAGACELSCIMCGQPKSPAVMGPAVLAALRDGLAAFPRPPILALAVRGEPLAHPDFPGAVRTLAGLEHAPSQDLAALPDHALRRRPPFRELYLDTNGQRLDAAAAEALLDVAATGTFVRLTVSTDAARPATYAAIRRGGALEPLLRNVARTLAQRAARGLAGPALNLQFIVMDGNAAEAGEFLERGRALFAPYGIAPAVTGKYPENTVDSLSLVLHHPLDPSPENLRRAADLHAAALARFGIPAPRPTLRDAAGQPCVWPFYMVVVRENGDLLPCCLDTRDTMVMGNLAATPLPDILRGPMFTRFRLDHIRDRAALPAKCRACPDQLVGERPGEKIARFLERVGR